MVGGVPYMAEDGGKEHILKKVDIRFYRAFQPFAEQI